MVLKPEKEQEAEAIFRKWGLDFAVVGETTPDKRFVVRHQGVEMALGLVALRLRARPRRVGTAALRATALRAAYRDARPRCRSAPSGAPSRTDIGSDVRGVPQRHFGVDAPCRTAARSGTLFQRPPAARGLQSLCRGETVRARGGGAGRGAFTHTSKAEALGSVKGGVGQRRRGGRRRRRRSDGHYRYQNPRHAS